MKPLNSVVEQFNESIFSTMTKMSLENSAIRDEVVVLEPFYDSYSASINLTRAKVVPVTLKAPDFHFNIDELKAAVR